MVGFSGGGGCGGEGVVVGVEVVVVVRERVCVLGVCGCGCGCRRVSGRRAGRASTGGGGVRAGCVGIRIDRGLVAYAAVRTLGYEANGRSDAAVDLEGGYTDDAEGSLAFGAPVGLATANPD